MMPQLLVRDVASDIVDGLKKRARAHGRSAEAEHRALLEREYGGDHSDFWTEAARLRAETKGRVITDSAELIRESRDSGWGL